MMSAVSIVSILVVAGCGGGGSSNASGPALPRTVYVARSNAICAAAAQRIKDAAPSVFPNLGQAGTKDSTLVLNYANTVVLPALQKEYTELSALRPTSDSDPHVTLSELEKSIDRWELDKTIMATVNDTSFARFDSLANDFGMTTCAMTDAMVRSITTGEPLAT